MALFENYERREAKILAVLKEYGISSIEECKEITLAKGPRYLEMTDGYVTGLALNEENEIIGYQFVNFGKMMDFIKAGDDANTALEKAKGQYGRVADAVRCIDPRHE